MSVTYVQSTGLLRHMFVTYVQSTGLVLHMFVTYVQSTGLVLHMFVTYVQSTGLVLHMSVTYVQSTGLVLHMFVTYVQSTGWTVRMLLHSVSQNQSPIVKAPASKSWICLSFKYLLLKSVLYIRYDFEYSNTEFITIIYVMVSVILCYIIFLGKKERKETTVNPINRWRYCATNPAEKTRQMPVAEFRVLSNTLSHEFDNTEGKQWFQTETSNT